MSKVKIQGNASGTGVLTVTAPNTSTDRTITLPDSTGTLATTADVPSSITDNGDATAITIDSSERVGIGTGSPTADLHIHNSADHTRLNIDCSNSSGDNWQFQSRNNGEFWLRNDDHSRNDIVVYPSTGYIGAKQGIVFGSDTAAANALDDYEEGTWSPTWIPNTSGSITTNTTYTGGIYTKVGNLVTVSWRLYTNSVSSPVGKITISGLPFTVRNSALATPKVLFPIVGLNANLAGSPVGTLSANTTTITVADWVWGVTESGTDIAQKFDNDVWSYGTFSYFT